MLYNFITMFNKLKKLFKKEKQFDLDTEGLKVLSYLFSEKKVAVTGFSLQKNKSNHSLILCLDNKDNLEISSLGNPSGLSIEISNSVPILLSDMYDV